MPEHETHSAAPLIFPEWVRPPLKVCLNRLEAETQYLHLSMRGLKQLTELPTMHELLMRIDGGGTRASEAATSALEVVKRDAAWVQREIDDGYPLLHAHSVVAVWSSLEVLTEDLAACWLENFPDAWNQPDIRRLKVSVGDYESLPAFERPRFIISELARAGATKLKTGLSRLDPLLSVFDLAPSVGDNVRRALHELSQVRNVIVHCGGRVDKKLRDECPWLPWPVGSTLKIDHKTYSWYHRAADRYTDRVVNQVLVRLGNEGCHCPGLDEINSRPVASAG